MNTDRWLCWHRPTTYSHSERFHLAFPSHILSGMASTHLVNTVVFIHIWPPGLAFTSAQESLEGPLLEICVLGFFYIHTVQTMQILLAAGPVFPAELVLASLGCFCLADGVGYFFLAPNKALVVATTQPNTVLLLLLTKAGEASDWNPPPAPAPPSCWGMWWKRVLSSLQPVDPWSHNTQWYSPMPSPNGETHPLLNYFRLSIFSLLMDSLDTGTQSSPKTGKLQLFQPQISISGRLTPNQMWNIPELQLWQDLNEWFVSLQENLQN